MSTILEMTTEPYNIVITDLGIIIKLFSQKELRGNTGQVTPLPSYTTQ